MRGQRNEKGALNLRNDRRNFSESNFMQMHCVSPDNVTYPYGVLKWTRGAIYDTTTPDHRREI